MRARVKDTIILWKTRCLGRTKDKRLVDAKLLRSQGRVKYLEGEVARLKQLTEPIGVPNHVYPAQLIALGVFIVVHGNGSLRCAAKTVKFVSDMMSWDYPLPSHVTIRRWTLRCGLYLLDYACSKTGEYIGVIDESIQIGREKMLLLLGVKLADDRSHCAALTMDDVEVLGVEVQQSWTGEDISSFIADRLDKHPQMKLKYVISDRGSNLLKALSMLGIPAVSDCSHWMMNAVKSLFGNNEVLSKLSSQIGQFRNRYTLTDKGFLVPPTLRDKDRFLKIFTIVQWVDRIDGYWKKLSTEQRNILGFMQQSRSLIRALRQVKTLVAMASQILKSAGLSHSSQLLWNNRVVEYRKGKRLTSQAKSFIQSIDQYFEQHQQLIKVNQRLICCSDIIESTFAHYKNKGGTAIISADALAITLYKQNLTTDFIVKALTTVSRNHIDDWEQKYTCDNRFSLLRRMKRELNSVA